MGLTDDPDALFLGFDYGVPISRVGVSTLVFEPGFDLGVADGPLDFFLRGTFHFQFIFPVGGFDLYPLGAELVDRGGP